MILISGVIQSATMRTGRPPQLGVILGIATALSRPLLIIRWGGRDARRPAGPVAVATICVVIASFVVGEVVGDLDLTPGPQSLFWLALLRDHRPVRRLLLISISLPRLPAIITSVILLTQPVMSMGLAIVLLGETAIADPAAHGLVIGGITAATVPVTRVRDGP